MKKMTFFVLFLLFAVNSIQAQQEVSWYTLSDVKWVKAFFPKLDDYYDFPKFGKKIKQLDNQQITIKGFYVPIDATGKIFALSSSPSSMCFFCNGGGIETVMEMIKKRGTNWKHLKTDQFIEVKGRLKLNVNDVDHLMYVLENAELVQIIKTK